MMDQDKKEQAAEVIDLAAEVIKATGWCAGELGDIRIHEVGEDGKHCAIGSLAAAWYILGHRRMQEYSSGARGGVYNTAIEAVADELPDEYWYGTERGRRSVSGIVDFNDSLDTRTGKRKVLAMFQKAAKALRQPA